MQFIKPNADHTGLNYKFLIQAIIRLTDEIFIKQTENLSCKQLDNFELDTHLLIQSTNYSIDEQVNFVKSLKDLIASARFSEIISTIYQGFDSYNRKNFGTS